MRTRQLLVPLLAILLAACNIDIRGDMHPGPLDDVIGENATEINHHYANLMRATTLDEGQAELARHALAMQTCSDDLRHEVVGMRCIDSGDGMMGLLSSYDARVTAYLADAEAATTLTEMRALAEDYSKDIAYLLDRMRDRADAWRC